MIDSMAETRMGDTPLSIVATPADDLQKITRGRQVAVQAEALTSSYEDRSGQKRTRVEFSVRNLQLLAGPSTEGRLQGTAEPVASRSRAYEKATAPGTDYSIGPEAFDDDEVPF